MAKNAYRCKIRFCRANRGRPADGRTSNPVPPLDAGVYVDGNGERASVSPVVPPRNPFQVLRGGCMKQWSELRKVVQLNTVLVTPKGIGSASTGEEARLEARGACWALSALRSEFGVGNAGEVALAEQQALPVRAVELCDVQ